MNNTNPHVMNGNNAPNNYTYTAPAECFSMRDVMPDYPLNTFQNVAVPLYQQGRVHTNYSAVLAGCCPSTVWILSSPKPCTAVCNTTSKKQTHEVRNCVIIPPGSDDEADFKPNAAMMLASQTKSSLALLLVGALALSGLLL